MILIPANSIDYREWTALSEDQNIEEKKCMINKLLLCLIPISVIGIVLMINPSQC
jgi:hypothetical protein